MNALKHPLELATLGATGEVVRVAVVVLLRHPPTKSY
jgi:hypothetical protein